MRDLEPAAELLDVTNRAELQECLGSLVTDAARRAGGRLSPGASRSLTEVLATTAVRTVPTLNALVGASTAPAPRVYGLALEGMSTEDRDFELARRFVRFAEASAGRVARTSPDRSADIGAAVEQAAREFAPGLAQRPARKETRMFETGTQTAEYGEAEYGRKRRGRWANNSEAEYSGYGQGEYGEAPYEAEYGEGEYGEAEQGGYGEAGQGGYSEFGESEEERFLPLIPIAGKVLGGLLGGLLKEGEGESEYGEYGETEGEAGEAGEAEEHFLGQILKKVLGQEAEHDETALSPAQEAEFAGHLMEVTNEEELDHFLGGLVNAVGKAVQGIRGAANSPQGRALIDAVKPLAKAALPALGGAIGTAIAPGIGTQVGRTLGSAAGSMFETEMSNMTQEQEAFEAARRFVRLTSAAAQDVATAPPGAPPQMVGEFSLFRAASRFARPLFGRALRAISPLSRRFFGRSGFGYRGGYRSGYWGGYRGGPYRRPYGYRGPRYGYRGYGYRGYGYPPAPEPAPEPPPAPPQPGPPQPGYRWVAVPVGAPDPTPAAPAEPPPPPGDGAGAGAAPAPAAQSEYGNYGGGYGGGYGNGHGGGRWIRRDGKIVVLGA